MSHQLVGFRFSGYDGVVDGEAVRLQDPAVGRHDVARLHEDDVAHDELVGGHLFFDALAKDVAGKMQVMLITKELFIFNLYFMEEKAGALK
jgi:hypothetical protein